MEYHSPWPSKLGIKKENPTSFKGRALQFFFTKTSVNNVLIITKWLTSSAGCHHVPGCDSDWKNTRFLFIQPEGANAEESFCYRTPKIWPVLRSIVVLLLIRG